MTTTDFKYSFQHYKDIDQLFQSDKKIAVIESCFYDHKQDFSDYDLVVVLDAEVTDDDLSTYIQTLEQNFNNKNVISILSGWNTQYKSHPKVFWHPLWFRRTGCCQPIVDTRQGSKSRLFDALLGICKYNRQYIFDQLTYNKLLDSSYVSILQDTFGSPQLYRTKELDAIDISPGPFNSYDYHQEYEVNQSCVIPNQVYADSWYSLIAETQYEHFTNYFTEKTAKALLAQRIFVMFGCHGHLANLQRLGFRTFNGIIDETYDTIENNQQRFDSAFEQVLWLSKQDPVYIYQQAQPILEHNYNLITDTEYFNKLLKEMINTFI